MSILREVYPIPITPESDQSLATMSHAVSIPFRGFDEDSDDDELIINDGREHPMREEIQRREREQQDMLRIREAAIEQYSISKALNGMENRFLRMLPKCAKAGILDVDFESRFVS